MKTRIFNLIILDESGSMYSIKNLAVTGVNETVQTIKSAQEQYEDQEHLVSLVTFNSKSVKTIWDRQSADSVNEIGDNDYRPDCGTPLYDAMGSALNKLRGYVADNDKVLVTIITDGYENASVEYSGKAIKALVEELKAKGWVFTYIGANQDVEKVASAISVTNVMNFQSTHAGTSDMFCKERSSRARWFNRLSKGISEADGNFFNEEE